LKSKNISARVAKHAFKTVRALLQTSLASPKAMQNFYGKLRFPDNE